jgi:hypothetical protein
VAGTPQRVANVIELAGSPDRPYVDRTEAGLAGRGAGPGGHARTRRSALLLANSLRLCVAANCPIMGLGSFGMRAFEPKINSTYRDLHFWSVQRCMRDVTAAWPARTAWLRLRRLMLIYSVVKDPRRGERQG